MQNHNPLTEVGIITMAYGKQKYFDQALTLARSLKLHMPNFKLAIITDRTDVGPLFDDVINICRTYLFTSMSEGTVGSNVFTNASRSTSAPSFRRELGPVGCRPMSRIGLRSVARSLCRASSAGSYSEPDSSSSSAPSLHPPPALSCSHLHACVLRQCQKAALSNPRVRRRDVRRLVPSASALLLHLRAPIPHPARQALRHASLPAALRVGLRRVQARECLCAHRPCLLAARTRREGVEVKVETDE